MVVKREEMLPWADLFPNAPPMTVFPNMAHMLMAPNERQKEILGEVSKVLLAAVKK